MIDPSVAISPEETQARLAECQKCENLQIMPDMGTNCSGCGCSIGFMTTLNFKECPLGRWTNGS